MGRGRRTRNYRELREQFDEAERRAGEDVEGDEDEEEEEDEDEEEEEEEEEGEGEEEEEISDEEEEDEDGIVRKKKKKKKVKEKVVKPRAKRTRASKVTRMKVVWGVFSNSNQRVATYEYKEKEDALAHAKRLTEAKPNNTHFVQPVKEPFEPKE